jgi:oligopeptide transport system substrate-binding protein
MRKLTSIIALLLALIMLLSFCACQTPGGNGEDTTGDNLTVETFTGDFVWKDSVSTLATNWNPHTYQTSDDSYPLDFIISGLYTFIFNDELNPIEGKDPYSGYVIVPEMAAEMPVDVTEDIKAMDGNKFGIPADATSGYAYKIALNPNAKWQDGTPINADTYIYSMQMLLDPKLMNYRATDYYDGDLAIAGANNYAHSGRTIKKANSSDGETMAYAVDALVKGEDGFYKTPDGAVVYIGLDDAGYGWMGGNTLTDYAGYFPEGVYDKLKGMADENGYVKVNDEALDTLYQFTGSDVWGNEPREQLGYYLSYDYTYANYTFDTVGCLKTGEYEITLVLEKSLSGFYLLYNLSGNWLVYQPIYDECIKEVGDTFTSSYNTSVETTMSYGPYKMTYYQADKSMKFEKNENWHGYTDGKHIYKDPEDGKIYPMYQTTAVDCQVVPEAETRKSMFLKGELMGYGLQAADFDTYRSSDYCYATPATSTFFLILNGHRGAIAEREGAEDFDKTKFDLECMTLTTFKQAMALSYDKELFASTVSPARSGGYGLIGTTYIYDPETGARYRDTDAAKKALCDFYAVDVSKYESLDAAVDSITGYDVEGARATFKKAYDEAIEKGFITDTDGNGVSDQTIRIEYCLSSDSDFMTTTIGYLNSALAEVLKTTPFEGKIEFVKSAPYGNAWSEKIRSGLADTVLGGWSGSALNPFSLTDLYVNSSRAYDAAWFDATTVEMTLNIGGEDVTLTLKEWSDALNGAAVTKGDKTYNYGDGKADIETRLNILAAFETRILQNYNYLPMLEDASMALLSQQVYYVVEEYNPVMGRGGIAYTKYNYNETDWAAYVAEQGADGLKY